jgi:hypothetical protein
MYTLPKFVPHSCTFFLNSSTNLPYLWISVPNETNSIDLFYKVALSSCTAPQIYHICGSQFHTNEWHRFCPTKSHLLVFEQLHKSSISVDLSLKCTYGIDLFHNDQDFFLCKQLHKSIVFVDWI